MKQRIALRYTNELLSNKEFDIDATNQMTFEATKHKDPIPNVIEQTGRTLSGRTYSHILSINTEFEIVISANEIDNSAFTFLLNFWTAKYKYLSIKENESSTSAFMNYRQVFTGGGSFPLTYIEEIKELKEVSLKLIADGWMS